MAINNLVGFTGKYKEMCKVLGEKPTDGNSKKKQIAQWKSKFKLERIFTPQGRVSKYKIVEVYDMPKPIEENRGKKHSIYRDDIETTLLYYLKHNLTQNKYLDFSMDQLFKITGIVSKNYNRFKEHKTLEEQAYYSNTYLFYRRNLEVALSDLKKQRLGVSTIYKVKNSNGNIRDATAKEYTDYNDLVVKLLENHAYKNISTVFFAGKQEKFYNELNSVLVANNVKPIKKQIRIMFSKIIVDFAIKSIEARKIAYNLNTNIAKGVIKSKSSYNPIYYHEEDNQNYFGSVPTMNSRKQFNIDKSEMIIEVDNESVVHEDKDFYVNYNKQQ